ncbi:hypothetical protein M0R45_010137 [Rubus argutus]|uniref:Uncharacterized protein n=1 Tax=Rubus argutus TaxID=59490 RepID=A0AAW1Y8K9_RUBAR
MQFRFVEVQSQVDFASGLAENLLRYAPEHVIYGDYAYESWDEELIEYVLGFFRPENMRVDVISKSSFTSEDFHCEPWFGSHYTVEDISASLMSMWNDPQEINVSLHLPAKNEYIPRDFSIRSDVLCLDIAANTSHPRCILDEPLMKFWYKLDSTFKLPLVNTYFRINLKGAYDSVKSCVLTGLYIDLLQDELNGITYDANIAGLGTSLSVYKDKLLLEVYGFNDKLPALMSQILETVKSFLPTCDRFEVIKEDMERACKKTNMDPWSHAKYLREQVLLQNFYTVDQQLTVLNGLSVSDLKSFIPELFSKLYLVGLFHGNLSEQEATTCKIIQNKLFCTTTSCRIDLRTKEQLGYVVLCGRKLTSGVLGFSFCVQSSEYNPKHLQGRLDNFINGLEELLEGLDNDSFENYKGGLIANLLVKDTTLGCETYRLWTEILAKNYTFESFDYSEKAAEELRSIDDEDVINFYKMYFQQSSPKCRRLATCVWGCNTDLIREARPGSVQVIEDLAAFKLSSNFFGRKTCQKVTPLSS